MRLTLEELRRNPDLRRLAGMEHSDDVPQAWNMSRFLAVLGREPFRGLLQKVFDRLVGRLGASVPDLGRHSAGDATHLSARRRGCYPSGLAAPDGGHKEYTNEEGKVTEVLEWFGYKLHVLCDTRHEVALAYDKACDDGQVHAMLKKHAIRPVIQHRSMWKDKESRVLEGAGVGNVVYDEAGTLYCYDMVSDPAICHRMAYIGHEPSRGTLKYRCPAEHESWRCPSSQRCNHGKRYGMTVRVKQEMDLRRFPPIPRATKKFERLYRGRSAVERVNARLKVFWGVDDGNVAGGASFHANVGVVLLVHSGLATLLARAPRRDPNRRLGQTRLSPVAKALHDR